MAGYGINVPYWIHMRFRTKIGELTSNCWCLTSNDWNCFTEFHQPRISVGAVGGSKNVDWTPGLVGPKELTRHLPQENSYQRLLEGQRRTKLHERALILLDPPYDSGTSYFTWNLFMLRRLRAAWPGAARQQRWIFRRGKVRGSFSHIDKHLYNLYMYISLYNMYEICIIYIHVY